MGIEGVDDLKSDETSTETEDAPERPTDQEVKERQDAELATEREEHNRRTGGGSHPTSDQRPAE